MTYRIEDIAEVSLNGVFYPIKGTVQSTLASIYPAKVVTGDTTRDSQQRASVLSWSDFRGGIGVERMVGATQVDRAWWSTAQMRFQGHLVLPPLATKTADHGLSGVRTIGAIGELASELYVCFGTNVLKYDNDADSWGSSLHTLPAAATDTLTVRLNDIVYMVFACDSHYVRTVDGATFEDEGDDIKYLTFWDERIWGIDSNGQLKWASALAMQTNGDPAPTWTDDAQLPLPNNYVTDLFVSRDAGGEPIIYATTSVGLYAHDAANVRFLETELTLPFHPNSGKGSTKWQDSLYLTAAEGILAYSIGPTAVVTVAGPDRDDGLFTEDGVTYSGGRIAELVPSHNDLIALLDATRAADPPLDMYLGSEMNSEGLVMQAGLGRSAVLAWNKLGWQVLWTSDDQTRAIVHGTVSNAYSAYRLWWAHDDDIYFMQLPQNILNPKQVSTFKFAASGELITPWFNADQVEVDKLALSLRVEVADASSTETVVVDYATNYDTDRDNYTRLGGPDNPITRDGTTVYLFPNSTTPTGTSFRSIRFRVTLARGDATGLSPDVVNMTFIYRKKLPTKYGHTFTVDMTRVPHKDSTAKQMRSSLLTATESSSLVEFTFRDDDGNSRNYYVDVVQVTGLEFTGHDERGETRVTVVEP